MSTALYRRYRPETFEDVIGQDHVVDALKNALDTSRTAHAYLFSGPRGCGKTTSARILARSLNCAQGPTSTPCGECESCVDLALDGDGSLDVIEIDAASHSSVEDARALRERATFAPARDRYRIFILDEAHMVTSHGFNALLKVVEEPPEHVKFIFATTEPEKVLNTIRSRTHHYPFRLVPPAVLLPYLKELVAKEGVAVEEGVYPLVVRAGAGSVRDALSVLDQLIAGAPDGVTTQAAVNLLGYTDAVLLEQIIEALGQGDGSAAFAVVGEVMNAGNEPRRFAEDLLQRFRDLMVCSLAQDRAADILPEVPEDALQTMITQAEMWGSQRLSRSADLVEETLRSMSDTTSPRLQLELLLARLMVEGGRAAGAVGATSAVGAAAPQVAAAAPAPAVPTPAASVPPVSAPAPAPPVQETRPSAPAAAPVPSDPGQPQASAAQAPTKAEVRGRWGELGQYVGQFSSAYWPLLQGGTRDVVSAGGVVTFVLNTEAAAQQLRNLGAVPHLAAGLSQIFGRPVDAQVASLENPPSADTPTPGPAATPPPPIPAPPAPTSEPPPAPEPEPTPPEPPAHVVQGPPAQAAEQVPRPEAGPPTPPVEVAWKGRPAVDVVLDVLGGQVIEERILDGDE